MCRHRPIHYLLAFLIAAIGVVAGSATAKGVNEEVRPIAFPVLGTVEYADTWGACRDGCARHHEGTDLLGVRMQPLLAAVDGTVTRIELENEDTAGVTITITGADGWYYNYFHVNNDTPGSDDGLAEPAWQVSPGLNVGSKVRAGQVIGYVGDSGNAEGSVPHLHFEIRTPDRVPVNPYPSLVAAQHGKLCPAPDTWTNTDLADLSPDAVSVVPLDGGGRWVIDRDGRLHVEGPGAGIPSEHACVRDSRRSERVLRTQDQSGSAFAGPTRPGRAWGLAQPT